MKAALTFASSMCNEGEAALEVCRRAEEAGFESLWGGEHVVMPDVIESKYPYSEDGSVPAESETSIPDPLIWLAFAAAATPNLRLGTSVLILPQRNPLVLAKELATLDRISGGRVELGLGVGWMKEEFEALQVPWERRGARSDEYVAAMKALWAGPHAEFHGEFVDFAPVTCNPRPVNGTIPILVGGDSDAAIRRTVRIADGYFPGEGDPERLAALLGRLREAAENAGRDPDSIQINVIFGVHMADPLPAIEKLAKLGVDRIMVPGFFFMGPGGLDGLSEFGERVVKQIQCSE